MFRAISTAEVLTAALFTTLALLVAGLLVFQRVIEW